MQKRDWKPSKEAQEKWNKLSKAQQIAAVRRRMDAGDSNVDAAMALGATPGQIAGIRNRHSIPAKNRIQKPKAPKRARVRSTVKTSAKEPLAFDVIAEFSAPEQPITAESIPELTSEPPPVVEPAGKPQPPYKLASTRFLACEDKWEDEHLCDYLKEEGGRYCELHNWMRKHPRT
jgi:hypothetical protein